MVGWFLSVPYCLLSESAIVTTTKKKKKNVKSILISKLSRNLTHSSVLRFILFSSSLRGFFFFFFFLSLVGINSGASHYLN